MADVNTNVLEMYVAFFSRPAEPAGAEFWDEFVGDALASGRNIDAVEQEIAARFADVPEAQDLYSFLADPANGDVTQFVNGVYANLFNRDAETEGLEFWQGRFQEMLDGGMPIEQAASKFVIEILNAAQNDDAISVQNKVQVAKEYTDRFLETGAVFTNQDDLTQARELIATTGADDESVDQANTLFTQILGENVTTDGVVTDGFVAGADVGVDENGDGILQDSEVLTQTDARGEFTFTDENGNAVELGGPILARGGTDTSTDQPVNGTLRAPEGYDVITPITTLVAALQDQLGSGIDEAERFVVQALGLPEDTDPSTFDPFSTLNDPNASEDARSDALLGQIKLSQLIVTVNETSQQAAEASGSNVDDVADATYEALASQIAGLVREAGFVPDDDDTPENEPDIGELDLTDAGTESTLTSAVGQAIQNSTGGLGDDDPSGGILQRVDETNGRLADAETLDEIIAILTGEDADDDDAGDDDDDDDDDAGPPSPGPAPTPNQPPTVDDVALAVSDNASAGAAVGQVVFNDPDGTVTDVTITAGNLDLDEDGENAFAIDNTGQITVNDPAELQNALDTPNDPFDLTVQVTDNDGETANAPVSVDVVSAPGDDQVLLIETNAVGDPVTVTRFNGERAIHKAVDAAGTDGDLILVGTGDFGSEGSTDDPIEVDTEGLTIRGAFAGTSATADSRGDYLVHDESGRGSGSLLEGSPTGETEINVPLRVNADDVTIDGVTFDVTANFLSGGLGGGGIAVDYDSGSRFLNSRFVETPEGNSPGVQNAYDFDTSSPVIDGLTLDDNAFVGGDAFVQIGAELDGEIDITNNRIEQDGTLEFTVDSGSGADITIRDNDFDFRIGWENPSPDGIPKAVIDQLNDFTSENTFREGWTTYFKGSEDADDFTRFGTDETEYLFTDSGNDTLVGKGGFDVLGGGGGDDNISGGAGPDYMAGDDFASTPRGFDVRQQGNPGDDEIEGGSGDDQIYGQGGNDQIYGQEGDDTLAGGDEDDLLDGGSGDDTAVFANARATYAVGLDSDGNVTVTDTNGAGGTDTLVDVESIQFGADRFTLSHVEDGDDLSQTVNAATSSDIIVVGPGDYDWVKAKNTDAEVISVGNGHVDVANANGTVVHQFMSSKGGLTSFGFEKDSGSGVSVALRARDGDTGFSPDNRDGNRYDVGTEGSSNPFQFEFQFTPRDGDTNPSDNYFLELQLDNDPTAGVNFSANSAIGHIFDTDTDDDLYTESVNGSWDDHDSLSIDGVTMRDGNLVEFNNPTGDRGDLPEYVVTNSWNAEWDFLLGDGSPGSVSAGEYDIQLTAYADDGGTIGEELASVQITAIVQDDPSAT